MYTPMSIRKENVWRRCPAYSKTETFRLALQPLQEVIDAGAADCHFEGWLRLCNDAQTSGLLDDAFYRLHRDDAAAGDPEELLGIEVFAYHIK